MKRLLHFIAHILGTIDEKIISFPFMSDSLHHFFVEICSQAEGSEIDGKGSLNVLNDREDAFWLLHSLVDLSIRENEYSPVHRVVFGVTVQGLDGVFDSFN